jgi:hypothetical protein
MPTPLPTRKWRVIAYIVGDQVGLPAEEAQEIDRIAMEEARKMVRAARGQPDMYLAAHVDLTLTHGGFQFKVPGHPEPTFIEEEQAGLKGIIDFVRESKDTLPAEHTMVILWGHGGGPLGLFDDPHGKATGGKGNGQLTLPDLRQLLTEARKTSIKGKTDILLVKSCYLATLEAAREIDDLTDYLICSQARVPLRTWTVWEEIFDQLVADPTDVVRPVIQAICKHYEDVAERNGRDEIPFSLLRPVGVREHLDAPIAALSTHLRARGGNVRIAEAIEQSRPAEGGDAALLDVQRLVMNLRNAGDPDIAAAAEVILAALRPNVVVQNTPEKSQFGGLGLFHFPREPLRRVESFANEVTRETYAGLQFSKKTRWHEVAFPTPVAAVTPKPVGYEVQP